LLEPSDACVVVLGTFLGQRFPDLSRCVAAIFQRQEAHPIKPVADDGSLTMDVVVSHPEWDEPLKIASI